ncbi:unnamed protein product [Brassica rapa subsp. trilocularis]
MLGFRPIFVSTPMTNCSCNLFRESINKLYIIYVQQLNILFRTQRGLEIVFNQQ